MVFSFVFMNKELVRVKGRGGLIPLHLASEIEDVEFLAKFLTVCPDSIEDVTVRGETALHIAVKNDNYDSLNLLVCFLKKNRVSGARKLEYKILNWKDGDDNTILHISTLNNQQPALQLLVNNGVNLKAGNFENQTALGIAAVPEIRRILICAGATEVIDDIPALAMILVSNTTIINKVAIYVCRFRNDILDEQRNTWLIIATLVATATYQSILSPPGGFYQPDATAKNLNITSSNSTITSNAGKSVLSVVHFNVFSHLNIFSFIVSTMAMLVMTPWGGVGSTLIFGPVVWFAASYLYSMWLITPDPFNLVTHLILTSLVGLGVVILIIKFIVKVFTRLQRQRIAGLVIARA
ncbi:ankyrin repeat-containing protein BDA1 [Trifolium repens]|nr:ankyrin repeat-containing protein BDA1 [Trifolium repens]